MKLIQRFSHLLLTAVAVQLGACGGGGGDAPSVAAPAQSSAWPAPANLPGFELSGWKLTLPVDASGGAGGANGAELPAQTLSPQQLVGGYASEWFHADAQRRIVFVAPANGVVTTPGVGSDHTRSELREVARTASANVDGYWVGSGTLSASCAVLGTASRAATVVVGQLRSAQHDFATLIYRPSTGEVALDMYAADQDASAHSASALATGLPLGSPIDYTISFARGELTVAVNGASRSFLAQGWSASALAFKVGAYHTAPNTGNAPNDATVVACSRFAVTH
jgi:hypothetical protein